MIIIIYIHICIYIGFNHFFFLAESPNSRISEKKKERVIYDFACAKYDQTQVILGP